MAYDAGVGRVVEFGGLVQLPSGGAWLNDTWQYATPHPAAIVQCGSGCASTSGVPLLANAPFRQPWLGDTFRTRVSNVAATSVAALFVTGLASTAPQRDRFLGRHPLTEQRPVHGTAPTIRDSKPRPCPAPTSGPGCQDRQRARGHASRALASCVATTGAAGPWDATSGTASSRAAASRTAPSPAAGARSRFAGPTTSPRGISRSARGRSDHAGSCATGRGYRLGASFCSSQRTNGSAGSADGSQSAGDPASENGMSGSVIAVLCHGPGDGLPPPAATIPLTDLRPCR